MLRGTSRNGLATGERNAFLCNSLRTLDAIKTRLNPALGQARSGDCVGPFVARPLRGTGAPVGRLCIVLQPCGERHSLRCGPTADWIGRTRCQYRSAPRMERRAQGRVVTSGDGPRRGRFHHFGENRSPFLCACAISCGQARLLPPRIGTNPVRDAFPDYRMTATTLWQPICVAPWPHHHFRESRPLIKVSRRREFRQRINPLISSPSERHTPNARLRQRLSIRPGKR